VCRFSKYEIRYALLLVQAATGAEKEVANGGF